MEGQSQSQSPSKSQLANWWRQLRNNPKAASSESLISRKTGQVRSFSPVTEPSAGPLQQRCNATDDTDFKRYRDMFLEKRYGFSGQVFNVSLTESLSVASAQVIVQTELASFGRIPIVVAKCGAYLKKNGLQTSGIFRIAGNNKRIRELQYIFSTPPNYGAKFNRWDDFTVHDVASLLRRYLNNLAEPLIPLSQYDSFREPLAKKPRIIKHLQKLASENSANEDSQDEIEPRDLYECDEQLEVDTTVNESQRQRRHKNKKKLTKDIKDAIKQYEKLFENLSDDSRQLFIYLLDLLGLFAQQSDKNLMPGSNLAAIFQPSIISHPNHDMDPKEYELSRIVVEFLIDYSYKLLPHLLKLKKKNPSDDGNSKSSNLRTNDTCPENVKLQVDPVTPTEKVSFSNNEIRMLTPPDPRFLDIPKTRPYSRSVSSANVPSDMIASRHHSKIPFLNKFLVSDTEDEYDSSSRPSSPKIGDSGSSNSIKMLKIPLSPVKINKEELTSFGMKTDSEFEDSFQERPSRSIRRDSWLKRLRSRSRSSVREQ